MASFSTGVDWGRRESDKARDKDKKEARIEQLRVMKKTTAIEKIRARLAAVPADAAGDYALHMWRHTFDCLESGRADASGALPYLPVAPETLGVALGADHRLLDAGCLGGHGMFDLAQRRSAAGLPVPRMTGLDIAFNVPVMELSENGFVMATAEALPFADETFRVVVARLLLPYVRIAPALAELRRVLTPGGLLYLQSHGPRYYRRKLLQQLAAPRVAFYYLRPLVSGWILRSSGRQPQSPRWRETAVSAGMLERLAARHGLRVVWRGTDQARPLLVLRRVVVHGA